MFSLDAPRFMELLTILFQFKQTFAVRSGPIPPSLMENNKRLMEQTHRLCADLGLVVSMGMADYIGDCTTGREVADAIECLNKSIHAELQQRLFCFVNPERRGFYEHPALFGEEVFNRFPSANEDIFEAGTCLALERGTACVMHSMRVVEVGLRVLAVNELKLPNRPDWGRHLKDIEMELQKREKAAGTRTPDELFYAEAAAQIGHVKTAWRNPSAHVDQSYSPERAEQILVAVRSLMQHLATRLREE